MVSHTTKKKKRKKKLSSEKKPQPSFTEPAPISLCMIVKNEEKYLPGCLESVKGLVKEMIVVDTGSSDKTIGIARQMGAQVVTIEWQEDFAAARNVALKMASQPWILYLDADERLPARYHDIIRKAIAAKQADAFYVQVYSPVRGKLGTAPHVQAYPRLFRKLPGVQFVGRIHEQITPALQKIGARFAELPVRIEHLGYDVDDEVLQQKILRNIHYLEKQVEAEPENAYARYQLGQTYIIAGRIAEGKKWLMEALRSRAITPKIASVCWLILGNVAYQEDDIALAKKYVKKALALVPVQRLGWFLLSQCYAREENWSEATHCLLQYLKYENIPLTQLAVDKILDRELIFQKLIHSLVQQKRFSDAFDQLQKFFQQQKELKTEWFGWYLQLLSYLPHWEEKWELYLDAWFDKAIYHSEAEELLGYLVQFLEEKELWDVIRFYLQRWVQYKPLSEMAWQALGNAYLNLGELEKAQDAYENAIKINPHRAVYFERMALIAMKSGRFPEAIDWYQQLGEKFPEKREMALRRMAALYLKMGEFQKAVECFPEVDWKRWGKIKA